MVGGGVGSTSPRILKPAVALLVLSLVAGCGSGIPADEAPARTPPVAFSFDGAAALDGWLFYNPQADAYPAVENNTLWNADSDTPGADPTLNFNNGATYATGAAVVGAALSPRIDVSTLSDPALFFRCNYETDSSGTDFDLRTVKVGKLTNGRIDAYVDELLSTEPGSALLGPCAAMGAWHTHTVALDPEWGTVRIAFLFDSRDGWENNHAGWFVDDLRVAERSAIEADAADDPAPSTPLPQVDTSDLPPEYQDAVDQAMAGAQGAVDDARPADAATTPAATEPTPDPEPAPSASSPPAPAVTTAPTYTTEVWTFDIPQDLDGWTLEDLGRNVRWAADGSPASVPGGASASAPNSLNVNDGADYDSGYREASSATSPVLVIADLDRPVLRFACNYETETAGDSKDFRWVSISNDGFTTNLVADLLSTSPGSRVFGACDAMGTWHGHEFLLDPAWGQVQIRFRFDTNDSKDNAHAGWFVDDVSVTDDGLPLAAVAAAAATPSLVPARATTTSKKCAAGPDAAALAWLAALLAFAAGARSAR